MWPQSTKQCVRCEADLALRFFPPQAALADGRSELCWGCRAVENEARFPRAPRYAIYPLARRKLFAEFERSLSASAPALGQSQYDARQPASVDVQTSCSWRQIDAEGDRA